MVFDLVTALILATAGGWLAALVFLVLHLRASGRAGRAESALYEARSELGGLQGRLEAFDSVRDELEYERDRSARLEREQAALSTRLEEREANLKDLRERLENLVS